MAGGFGIRVLCCVASTWLESAPASIRFPVRSSRVVKKDFCEEGSKV